MSLLSPHSSGKDTVNGFTAVNERPSPPSASRPQEHSPSQQREPWSHSTHNSPTTINGDKVLSPQSGLSIKRRYGEVDPGSDDQGSHTVGSSSMDGRNGSYHLPEGEILDPRLAQSQPGAVRDPGWPPQTDEARMSQLLQANINGHPEDIPHGARHDAGPPMNGDMNLVTPRSGIPYDKSKRKRAFTNRTKTGCTTCRKRKKKCDEAKPHCNNCLRGGFTCGGYQQRREMGDSKLAPQSKYPPVAIQSRGEYWDTQPRPADRNHVMGMDGRPYMHDTNGQSSVDYWRPPAVNGSMRPLGADRSLPPPMSSPHTTTHAPSTRPYSSISNGYSTSSSFAPMQLAKNVLQQTEKISQHSSSKPVVNLAEESPLEDMINKKPFKEGAESLVELRKRAAEACDRYNKLSVQGLGTEELLRSLRNIIEFDPKKPNETVNYSQASDRIGENVQIAAPFYAEYGFNLRIGSSVTIKGGCRFEDTCNISIGDDTCIGPNVIISGQMHYSNFQWRPWRKGVDIKIGSGVYIGAGAIIAPEDPRGFEQMTEIIIPDGCYVAPGAVITLSSQTNSPDRHISAQCSHSIPYDARQPR